jgi:hypothetical protein
LIIRSFPETTGALIELCLSAGQSESSELLKTNENKKRDRSKGAKNKKTLEREENPLPKV